MVPTSLKPQELRTATNTVQQEGSAVGRREAQCPRSCLSRVRGRLLVKLHEACLKYQWSGTSLEVQWLDSSPNAGAWLWSLVGELDPCRQLRPGASK